MNLHKWIDTNNQKVRKIELHFIDRLTTVLERAKKQGHTIRIVRRAIVLVTSDSTNGYCNFTPDADYALRPNRWDLFLHDNNTSVGIPYHDYGELVQSLENLYPVGGVKDIFVEAVDKRLGVIREWMKTSPVALYIQATANGEWGLLIKDHGQGGEGERWLHKWPTMEEFLVGVEEIIKKEKQNAAR